MTVDEASYCTHLEANAQAYFQHMPKKPAKYGLKFETLADAQSYSNTLRAYLYKPIRTRQLIESHAV